MTDPKLEFDAAELAQLLGRAKRQIRQRMRALRTNFPQRVVTAKSEAICDRLVKLPPLSMARSVALFSPIAQRREVDLGSLDRELRTRQRRLYYPFMDPTETGFRTGFRLSEQADELAPRSQPFPEPPVTAPEAARGDIDVVIVPALAVASDGHRIGYGKGYYDATLPDVVPPAVCIVVAFEFQLLAEVPHEAHDVACDWVVTEERELEVHPPSTP